METIGLIAAMPQDVAVACVLGPRPQGGESLCQPPLGRQYLP